MDQNEVILAMRYFPDKRGNRSNMDEKGFMAALDSGIEILNGCTIMLVFILPA